MWESMCLYVRKSAHERKQVIKQMGQIFNDRRIWVKVTGVFYVRVSFLHI